MGFGISNSKILAECDRKAGTVLFLRSPRKTKGTRGHNPDNKYAIWRAPLREARRKMGWPLGRQWVKFRKFGSKAYKKFVAAKAERGIVENPTN